MEGSLRGQNFPGNSDLDFAEETKNLDFHGQSPNFRKVPMNEIFFFNAMRANPGAQLRAKFASLPSSFISNLVQSSNFIVQITDSDINDCPTSLFFPFSSKTDKKKKKSGGNV